MGSLPQAGTNHSPARATSGTGGCPAPAITLCPLHPHDPLLGKWQLAEQLPPPADEQWAQTNTLAEANTDAVGHLRLSTSHKEEAEEPWECRVPFSALAREGGMVLGRCPHTADIALPHASVSRRHALLEIAENGLVITDLSSTNGTCVNEQELSPFDRRVPLFHGTSLLLGDANLRLEYIH